MLGPAAAAVFSSSEEYEESSSTSSRARLLLFAPRGGVRLVMRFRGAMCVVESSTLLGRVRRRNLNGEVEGASACVIGGEGSCVGGGGGVSMLCNARHVE